MIRVTSPPAAAVQLVGRLRLLEPGGATRGEVHVHVSLESAARGWRVRGCRATTAAVRAPPHRALACRLGALLLSRPVAVAVWFQEHRTRGQSWCDANQWSALAQPPAARRTQSASTHLDRKFCGEQCF